MGCTACKGPNGKCEGGCKPGYFKKGNACVDCTTVANCLACEEKKQGSLKCKTCAGAAGAGTPAGRPAACGGGAGWCDVSSLRLSIFLRLSMTDYGSSCCLALRASHVTHPPPPPPPPTPTPPPPTHIARLSAEGFMLASNKKACLACTPGCGKCSQSGPPSNKVRLVGCRRQGWREVLGLLAPAPIKG